MPRRYSYGRRQGSTYALQHIAEAQALSRELGGADEDVKRYFFSLTKSEIDEVMKEYGQRYGVIRQEYAELTYPKWKSGRVHMSGLVASRLFNLLPERMPLSKKYELTENMWRHYGPSSRKVARVGPDVDVAMLVEVVQLHIEEVVVAYRLPDSLERRFNWLSAGDVHIKQQLLNAVQEAEKSLVIEAVQRQAPVMLDHMNGPGQAHTRRFTHTLTIGKHVLEVVADPSVSGVTLEDAFPLRSRVRLTGEDGAWTWLTLAAGAVILALASWLYIAR